MAWAALGKAALGAVKGKAKKIAADKLLNRKKNVKNRRAKAQTAMQEGGEEKGGALAIRPSTSLIPTGPTGIIQAPPTDSGGAGDDTSTPAAALMTIQTKIVKVEKLLAGSNAVKEKIREDQRQAAKDEEDKSQEKNLEKKVPKVKSKFKMPNVPGAGIFGTIWKFITTVVMGRLFMIFFDNLPKLMPFIKGAALVVDGLLIAAGWLLNVGVTIIDWGYKLVDGMSNWVGDTFGEGAQKAFNGLLDVIKHLINGFLVWKIIGKKLFEALIRSITRAFRIARIIVKRAIRFAKKAIKFAKNALKFAKNLASRVGKNLLKIPGVKNVVQGATKLGGKALQAGGKLLGKATGFLKVGAKGGAKAVGGFVGKIFGKAAKFIGPAFKSAKPFVSKFFGRIPIVGPLIVGIVSLLSGEPAGKAIFKTIGAALGGFLGGTLAAAVTTATVGIGALVAPAMVILGELIGTFVGDMLYELIFGGGLKKVLSNLKKMVGDAFGKLLDVGKWLAGGFSRFYEGIPKFKVPDFPKDPPDWIPSWVPWKEKLWKAATIGLKVMIGPLSLLMGKEIPNLLWMINPLNTGPLLVKSFFPPGGEKTEGGEKPAENGKQSAEIGAPDKDKGKDKGKDKKDQSVSPTSTQEEELISTNQKNGAQGVIDKIDSYASYEEQGGPTIIKVPNPQTSPQSMEEGKAAGEPILVPVVTSKGAFTDPYEDLDFFG